MVSIIIPTRNRLAALKRTLRAFEQQHNAGIREIILVDDHSSKEVRNGIDKFLAGYSLNIKLFSSPGHGPAIARNAGIQHATGSILLFSGDDTLPDADLVRSHLEFHIVNNDPGTALVGKISWAKDLKITRFMDWLENGGPQFGFPDCADICKTDYRFFYSSNASVKRDFLLAHGIFDEDFPFASYEDIELAYRLSKTGKFNLYYDPHAHAYHHHPVTFLESRHRMRRVGYSANLLVRKHPELKYHFDFIDKIVNARFKNAIRMIFFPVGYLFRSNKITHAFFWQIMAKYFINGYNSRFEDVSE